MACKTARDEFLLYHKAAEVNGMTFYVEPSQDTFIWRLSESDPRFHDDPIQLHHQHDITRLPLLKDMISRIPSIRMLAIETESSYYVSVHRETQLFYRAIRKLPGLEVLWLVESRARRDERRFPEWRRMAGKERVIVEEVKDVEDIWAQDTKTAKTLSYEEWQKTFWGRIEKGKPTKDYLSEGSKSMPLVKRGVIEWK